MSVCAFGRATAAETRVVSFVGFGRSTDEPSLANRVADRVKARRRGQTARLLLFAYARCGRRRVVVSFGYPSDFFVPPKG